MYAYGNVPVEMPFPLSGSGSKIGSITIQPISITEINYAIHWIVIYPVDSAIQRLNNRGLGDSAIQCLNKWGQVSLPKVSNKQQVHLIEKYSR